MNWMFSLGYPGLFIGSFLASTVIPFSADALLIAMLAAGGNIGISLTMATLGNWLGGMTSYYLGWLGKWEWIEKWLRVKRERLESQKSRVDKWGVWLALFAWLPIVGDLFAIALGFYKVSPRMSAAYMLVGRAVRFGVWAVIFYYVK